MCTNPEELVIWGDFQSSESRQFNIDLILCSNDTLKPGDPFCWPQKNITDHLRGKYLLILVNEVVFDNAAFGAESIVRQSNMIWRRVNPHFTETTPFKVSQKSLELQDLLLDLDAFTVLEDTTVFQLEEM